MKVLQCFTGSLKSYYIVIMIPVPRQTLIQSLHQILLDEKKSLNNLLDGSSSLNNHKKSHNISITPWFSNSISEICLNIFLNSLLYLFFTVTPTFHISFFTSYYKQCIITITLYYITVYCYG